MSPTTPIAVAPHPLEDAIRRPVEVDAVDVVGRHSGPVRRLRRRRGARPAVPCGRGGRAPVKCVVTCGSGCPGSVRLPDEAAVGDEPVTVGTEHGLEAQRGAARRGRT